MNKDNSKKLLIMVIFLSVLVVLLSGYLIYDKVLSNKENDDNEEITNNNTNDEDNNEISLEKLKGVWMNCGLNELNNKVCYTMSVEEQENKYIVRVGMYGTDGVTTSEITKFKKLENNKYQLELYSEGYDGSLGSSPAQTNTLTIDTSNNRLVIYNEANNKYEYVTDDLSNNLELEEYYNNN